jgi:hypothetical protein
LFQHNSEVDNFLGDVHNLALTRKLFIWHAKVSNLGAQYRTDVRNLAHAQFRFCSSKFKHDKSSFRPSLVIDCNTDQVQFPFSKAKWYRKKKRKQSLASNKFSASPSSNFPFFTKRSTQAERSSGLRFPPVCCLAIICNVQIHL